VLCFTMHPERPFMDAPEAKQKKAGPLKEAEASAEV
jgi:hypothetical protein